jgi:DNA mismatch repair ATPase MutS
MKKIISFLVFINIAVFAYSQPNYANGNGTIIKFENTGNTTRTFRKHIQRIQIKNIIGIDGNFIENLNLYKNPEIKTNEIVGKLNYGDFINI